MITFLSRHPLACAQVMDDHVLCWVEAEQETHKPSAAPAVSLTTFITFIELRQGISLGLCEASDKHGH